jgi:CRISPR-associated protein Cmr1
LNQIKNKGEVDSMAKFVTLLATYCVVTPMFLGGANHDEHVELRPPSIKGALRFWWRALQWARIKPSFPDENSALRELHKQEAALFGSASGGQSQVLLRIRHPRNADTVNKGSSLDEFVNRPGARYLGYGVMDTYGKLTRPALWPAFEILVEITCREAIGEGIPDVLKLLGLLGGLGSKVRKGYGSLALVRLQGTGIDWHAPRNADEYVTQIHDLLSLARTLPDAPPFSAFSRRTRVSLLLERDDPLAVLDDYGRQMQRYRSWGNGGMVNSEDSEKNFDDDHEWYYGRPPNANFHPRRVIFGLPHNYFGKKGAREVSAAKLDRRASPLWFHVHDFGKGSTPRYAGIATVLHSQFLPEGERIKVGGKSVPVNAEYEVIDEFLDGCVGDRDEKTSDKYFPKARQVFP